MKSRAVVVGRFPDYTVREFEVPACGAEGLIVKVAAAPFGRRGLVDLRLDGAMDGRLRDFIPGGEIIGRVVSAPPAAAEAWKVSEGDMVYIEPNIVCGFCKPCLTGNYSVCREQLRYGSFPLAERRSFWPEGSANMCRCSRIPAYISSPRTCRRNRPCCSERRSGPCAPSSSAAKAAWGSGCWCWGLTCLPFLPASRQRGSEWNPAEIYAPDALETDRAAAEACGCVFTGEVAAGGYDIVLVSDAARENVEWAWRASCPQGRLVFAVPPELAEQQHCP